MFFQYFAPSLRLQPIIKQYLLFRWEFDKGQPTLVKPFPVRPQQSMAFYLQGGCNAYDFETGYGKKLPKINVNGSQTKRYDLHVEASQYMLSIEFQPNGLFKFLRMPLSEEFLDGWIDAEALLSPEIGRVYEQMVNAPTYQQVIEIIDDYIWQKISGKSILTEPFDWVGQLIFQHPDRYSIEVLAKDACLSISQFQRRFKQQMGISPKYFVRVNRFYKAYMLRTQNPSLDWLSIALQTGYNDYQHMVRDFKQFAGTTPNSLLQACEQSPERLLGFRDFA
jgi:AraC-like DNA-binding protein